MGGMIAQELTLRYPDRVLSLALGCTSHSGVLGRWPHFRFGPRNLNWARAGRFERERALRPLLYASSTPLELIEEDLEVRCRCRWSNKGFWNQFIAILRWTAYRRLPSIRVPTLVLHGAEDHLVPPENGQAIAARIPNARFHLLPEAGHILTTDRPEIAIGLVTEFLREQNQGAPETEP